MFIERRNVQVRWSQRMWHPTCSCGEFRHQRLVAAVCAPHHGLPLATYEWECLDCGMVTVAHAAQHWGDSIPPEGRVMPDGNGGAAHA